MTTSSGRKTALVPIPASWGGRDSGKLFLLTEKSARAAEQWAWRLFFAVKGTSVQVPEAMASYGMMLVAIRGINSFMAADVDYEKIKPLLDEMLECVQIIRDKAHPEVATALISDDDIEEVATLGFLRDEVIKLHTNFSFLDVLSKWASTIGLMTPDSSATPTSLP